jgi:hypothetical protein
MQRMTFIQPSKNALLITGVALIAAAFAGFPLSHRFFEHYYGSHGQGNLQAYVFLLQALAAYTGSTLTAFGIMKGIKEKLAVRIMGVFLLSLALCALVTVLWALLWVKSYV